MADILVTIPDQDLPELADKYEKIKNTCPYVYSFITTAIHWKQQGKNTTTFMSPKNCWQEDGTFIALMEFGNYDIFLFTFDEKCTNLYEGLKLTKRINWRQATVFFNLHSLHYPTVMRVVEEIGLDVHFVLPYDVVVINQKNALNFDIGYPENTYIKKLDTSLAPLIDSLYKAHRHRYPDGDKFIATLIEANNCFGLFSKETNELLAWVMKTCLGQIGFLQTMEQHKKKGYASILTKAISKDIAKLGHMPMGSVDPGNVVSHHVFQKLGFYKMGQCYFLEVKQMK